MKLLIHDLKNSADDMLKTVFEDINNQVTVISNNNECKFCIGCFNCWNRSAGTCILKDGYEKTGSQIGKCDELIIISECVYGGFSPFVKRLIDRSISCVLPFFEIVEGKMRHKMRYKNSPTVSVYFYGTNISESDKSIANRLVSANARNFHMNVKNVDFTDNIHGIFGGKL